MKGEGVYGIRISTYPIKRSHCPGGCGSFIALPSVMRKILSYGGLVEHVKKYKDLNLA
jgi:hypothetical protein